MITDQQLQLIQFYNQALALYKERKWSEARAMFQKGLALVPDDGPSQLYVTRCDAYLKDPPDADWDGVFVMKTK